MTGSENSSCASHYALNFALNLTLIRSVSTTPFGKFETSRGLQGLPMPGSLTEGVSIQPRVRQLVDDWGPGLLDRFHSAGDETSGLHTPPPKHPFFLQNLFFFNVFFFFNF